MSILIFANYPLDFQKGLTIIITTRHYKISDTEIFFDETFYRLWKEKNPFHEIELLEGEVYRELEKRRTLRFKLNGKFYFIKIHRGISYSYFISDLLRFRMPVLSAKNEWQAIRKLELAGIATMKVAAYGTQTHINFTTRHSFIITHALQNTISLEELGLQQFKNKKTLSTHFIKLKRKLTLNVAVMSKKMHQAGINHRDFYLCHFLLYLPNSIEMLDPDNLKLWLIDLHRSQIRSSVPQRWLLKDLAALYFSSFEFGLTRRDYFRFIKAYTQLPLKKALQETKCIWPLLQHKADKLYARYNRRFATN